VKRSLTCAASSGLGQYRAWRAATALSLHQQGMLTTKSSGHREENHPPPWSRRSYTTPVPGYEEEVKRWHLGSSDDCIPVARVLGRHWPDQAVGRHAGDLLHLRGPAGRPGARPHRSAYRRRARQAAGGGDANARPSLMPRGSRSRVRDHLGNESERGVAGCSTDHLSLREGVRRWLTRLSCAEVRLRVRTTCEPPDDPRVPARDTRLLP
jgi:hypothetical protein